jgi:hypothetical protein
MKTPKTTGEPRLASLASWAVLVASFALSAATWIDLARLAGFSHTANLGPVTVDLAWLMPVAVDGYVVVALVLWMSPVPAEVADFAKKNTYAAAGTGIAAQSIYHALTAASTPDTPLWRSVFAAVVGALPPAVAGLAVHMRALIRRHANTPAPAPVPADTASDSLPTAETVTDPAPAPAPISDPAPEALPAGPRVPSSFLPASTPINGHAFTGGAQ